MQALGVDSIEFKDLVDRARGGCQAASRELYERYAKHFLRIIRHRLNREVRARLDAEDILQSVVRQFFTEVLPEKGFDGPEHLLAYIGGMIEHRVQRAHRDHLRTAKREANREAPIETALDRTAGDDPARLAEVEDSWQTLLAACTPGERSILLLLRNGHSQSDAARQLGLDENFVRRAVRRIADRHNRTWKNR